MITYNELFEVNTNLRPHQPTLTLFIYRLKKEKINTLTPQTLSQVL